MAPDLARQADADLSWSGAPRRVMALPVYEAFRETAPKFPYMGYDSVELTGTRSLSLLSVVTCGCMALLQGCAPSGSPPVDTGRISRAEEVLQIILGLNGADASPKDAGRIVRQWRSADYDPEVLARLIDGIEGVEAKLCSKTLALLEGRRGTLLGIAPDNRWFVAYGDGQESDRWGVCYSRGRAKWASLSDNTLLGSSVMIEVRSNQSHLTPGLWLPSERIDLGVVAGEPTEHRMIVFNRGQEPIEVAETRFNCKCAKAAIVPAVIPASGFSELLLTVPPRSGASRDFDLGLMLVTSEAAPYDKRVLRITGRSRVRRGVFPSVVSLGEICLFETTRPEVHVAFYPSSEGARLKPYYLEQGLSWQGVKRVSPDEYQISVHVDPSRVDADVNHVFAASAFVVDEAVPAEVHELVIEGRLLEPLEAFPKSVMVGTASAGQVVVRKCRIENRTNHRLEVNCADPAIRPVLSGNVLLLEVTVPRRLGPFRTGVVVRAADAFLFVPVTGTSKAGQATDSQQAENRPDSSASDHKSRFMARKRALSARMYCAILLAVHVLLGVQIASSWSPNSDELAHLAGGIALWREGDFARYSVNPPLVRMIAAVPAMITSVEADSTRWNQNYLSRPEFGQGRQLVDSYPQRWWSLLVGGRVLCLLLTIVGGVVCFRWSQLLFGNGAACIAVTLWCVSPNVLAWCSTICSDGAAASLGLAGAFLFWRWLKEPDWSKAIWAGVGLGLAQLSKMTWVILFPLWPFLWLPAYLMRFSQGTRRRSEVFQFAAILIVSIYVVNLGYGFDGTFARLGDFRFFSALGAADGARIHGGPGGNRFAGTPLDRIPVPLPEHYLLGADLQRVDFEQGLSSFLLGEWRDRGWCYYYFVGLAVKIPLGTWLLGILAAVHSCAALVSNRLVGHGGNGSHPSARASVFDQIVLLAPAIALVIFVSSQYGFSRHFRYLLPALPFVFIWISKVAIWASRRARALAILVLAALLWSVASSLTVFPHSMSYFNELAGGPRGGHYWMLHSSYNWSQDLYYFKSWLANHPGIEDLRMHVEGFVPLKHLGIPRRKLPPTSHPQSGVRSLDLAAAGVGPIPGWHAIDVQHVHERDGGYAYFLHFQPVAMAGYSIHIYHITLDEANRVRQELGLPQLKPEDALHDTRAGGEGR